MRVTSGIAVLVVTALLAACGGGDSGGTQPAPTPVPVPTPTPTPPPPAQNPVPAEFAEVDRVAAAAFAAQGISGMGLQIYDSHGVKRFEHMYGAFSSDQ